MCLGILPVYMSIYCVYVCTVCVPCVHEDQKWASDLMELELWIDVSCHLGGGN